jgi:DNA-binding CsgD family transcriptional regulator/tetratricopeptide (TPR) repeat protein
VTERRTQGRLIGRVDELAWLDARLRAAASGTPRVVLVAGEAGVGKTRLVGRLADEAAATGSTVLDGDCLPLGRGGPPYAPVVALLRSLRRAVAPGELAAILGPGRADLARLVPELVDRAADVPQAPVDPASQIRLFELVASVLERLARRAPLVVVVEDVQWIDRSSRDLLEFVVRGLSGERLLLVLTIRTDDPGLADEEGSRHWLAELGRLPEVDRLDVGPLPAADVAALVAQVLGHEPQASLVDGIVDRAGGNPFLTEALAEAAAAGVTDIPDRLRELVAARLAVLEPTALAVLRAASAAGREVDDGLLADALGLPEGAVHAAMREATDTGILVRTPGGDDGPRHRFRHGLLRDAVYDELFPRERRRLHAAFATALATRARTDPDGVPPAELAIHWDAADEPRRALGAHVRAGRAAFRVYAFPEARRHDERALALWDQVATAHGPAVAEDAAGIARPDLLEATAEAAALDGDYDRAVALIREAITIVDPVHEPARAGDLRERLRWFLWEAGDRPAAAEAVAEALRIVPSAPPSTARARALAHAAGLEMLAGRPREALEGAEAALIVARAASGLPEEALALGVAGWATGMLGDVDAGVARFREALRIAEVLSSVEGVALGYTNLVGLLDRAGRTEEALAAANEGFVAVERSGLGRTFGGILLGHAARLRFHLGRWSDAAATVDRALALRPVARGLAYVRIQEARLAAATGDDARARLALAEAEALVARPGVVEHRMALLGAGVERAAWVDDLEAGRSAVDAALALDPAPGAPDPALGWIVVNGLRIEADAAEVARPSGRAAAVTEAVERGRRLVEGARRWIPADPATADAALSGRAADRPVEAIAGDARAPAIVALGRAELGRLEGRDDPAAWVVAVARWSRLGRPLPAAYARYRAGAAVLASGGPRSIAREHLAEARVAADELGAAPLVDRIVGLGRLARLATEPTALGATGPGATRPGPGGALTEREQEVLGLVALGWSNPEIAEALGISVKTAGVHVSNILGKLGVANRTEAAVAATRLGLGRPGRPDRVLP